MKATPRSSTSSTCRQHRYRSADVGVRGVRAETGEPARDASGRVRKVPSGQPGLLLSRVSKLSPDGYTDPAATEKKLVRNAFRMVTWVQHRRRCARSEWGMRHSRPPGRHLPVEGENVATTDVEAALSTADCVEECTVFGRGARYRRPRGWRHQVADGASFDGLAVANAPFRLPDYAVPLFVRLVDLAEVTDVQEPQAGPSRAGVRLESGRSGFTSSPDAQMVMCPSIPSIPARCPRASAPLTAPTPKREFRRKCAKGSRRLVEFASGRVGQLAWQRAVDVLRSSGGW